MNETNIVLYTTSWCPYCHLAKRLLASKGVAFEEIDVDGNPELRAEVARRSGQTTVPQAFVDGVARGGFDDLMALEEAGELDAILGLRSGENDGS